MTPDKTKCNAGDVITIKVKSKDLNVTDFSGFAMTIQYDYSKFEAVKSSGTVILDNGSIPTADEGAIWSKTIYNADSEEDEAVFAPTMTKLHSIDLTKNTATYKFYRAAYAGKSLDITKEKDTNNGEIEWLTIRLKAKNAVSPEDLSADYIMFTVSNITPDRGVYIGSISGQSGMYSGTNYSVSGVQIPTIAVSSVTLDKPNVTLIEEGNTQTLTATVEPEDAANKAVIWESSDTNVVTVVPDGTDPACAVLTPGIAGEATITVTTVDGGKIATCSVKVEPKPVSVTGVTLNKTELTLTKGVDIGTLIASVLPDNASNQNVSWTSDNLSVATVTYEAGSKTATITPMDKGTATITVKTEDGNFEATCMVTVKIPVSGVSLNETAITLPADGSNASLTATIDPAIADNQNLTWSSSNESVVQIIYGADPKTVTITTKGVGTATVTVTTEDGNHTATCIITVTPVAVTGVTLDKETMSLYAGGQTGQLTAIIAPTNATNKATSWTSSNELVATVDQNGVITPMSVGTAVITVTTADGSKNATCNLTVASPVEVVHFNATDSNGNVVSQFQSQGFYNLSVKLHATSYDIRPLTVIQVKDNTGQVVEFDSFRSVVRTAENGDLELTAGFRLPAGANTYTAQVIIWNKWISELGTNEQHLSYSDPDDNVITMVVNN